MKISRFARISIFPLIALTGLWIALAPSQRVTASNHNQYSFECISKQGTPTTLAKNDSWGEEREFIRWTSPLAAPEYTPERRCNEVTNRINTAIEKDLRYLTHGIMNNQPVICFTKSEGIGCDMLFYTMREGIDPKERIEDIFTLNARNFADRPLREAPCSTYVSIDKMLEGEKRFAREVCSSDSASQHLFLRN